MSEAKPKFFNVMRIYHNFILFYNIFIKFVQGGFVQIKNKEESL